MSVLNRGCNSLAMRSNYWTYTSTKLSIDQRIKLKKEVIVESKSQSRKEVKKELNCRDLLKIDGKMVGKKVERNVLSETKL